MKGKLIVIEGTDCSGKETQSKLLVERLKKEGHQVFSMPFPRYDTPTGAIIGGPLLGKSYICDSFFKDEAPRVDGRVASLYYAADRFYNVKPIIENLENGVTVILDRWTQSNMAFQGAKFENSEDRLKMYKFIESLEYDLLGLPKPDGVIFLHLPYENAKILRKSREEKLDKVESDDKYLKDGERAYLELADLYGFKTVECALGTGIRTINDIHEEVYRKVMELIDGEENC